MGMMYFSFGFGFDKSVECFRKKFEIRFLIVSLYMYFLEL